jgi:hypothetical protein
VASPTIPPPIIAKSYIIFLTFKTVLLYHLFSFLNNHRKMSKKIPIY